MAVLSKRLIDGLAAPAAAPLLVWDDRLKGFGLRVNPNGTKSFVVQYRTLQGRQRRLTIGRFGEITVEQARREAADKLAAARGGEDPAEDRAAARRAPTLEAIIGDYLAEGPAARPNKKESSWKTDAANLQRHAVPLLGSRIAAELTRADIEGWQRAIAAGRTAGAVRTKPRGVARVRGGRGVAARALDSVRACLSWAAASGRIPVNPAAGVIRIKGQPRERFLSAAELARLGEALARLDAEGAIHPHVKPVVRLLALTGARTSEILSLRWADIDFGRGCLTLADSKAGRQVRMLPAPALEILAELPRMASPAGGVDWCFPASRGGGHFTFGYRDWQKLVDAAGLPGVRRHDLRHTLASTAVAAGVSLYVTGSMIGHKSTRMTQRYAHLADDPLRLAAEQTAATIAAAMAGSPPAEVVDIATARPAGRTGKG